MGVDRHTDTQTHKPQIHGFGQTNFNKSTQPAFGQLCGSAPGLVKKQKQSLRNLLALDHKQEPTHQTNLQIRAGA